MGWFAAVKIIPRYFAARWRGHHRIAVRLDQPSFPYGAKSRLVQRLSLLARPFPCNRVAGAQASPKTKNVVFVHGLFADGSCWSKVIARLQQKGTFYAVSTQDRTINPDLESFMAKRMSAKSIEIKASRLALISHPDAITNLILEALAV